VIVEKCHFGVVYDHIIEKVIIILGNGGGIVGYTKVIFTIYGIL